jgi:hypothetical protein
MVAYGSGVKVPEEQKPAFGVPQRPRWWPKSNTPETVNLSRECARRIRQMQRAADKAANAEVAR